MIKCLSKIANSNWSVRAFWNRKAVLISFLSIVFLTLELSAQNPTITGTVISSEGNEALPGVNVIEKGTTNGTVTDADGNYSLSVSEGASLVFSSIGYQTQEIIVGNKTVIEISMLADVQQLEELVVVGYGTQKKSDLTGAVGSVSGDDLNSIPITSVEQGLQGRVAGVHVTNNSSAPGGGMSIKIRGTTSILNGSEPLYVIDGFPVTGQSQFQTDPGRGESNQGTDYTVTQNPLANLNPADIESIEVLKDASAAAIYGVRGANGVILITTKRGRKGAPVVSYHGYVGNQSPAKKYDMMNAQEYQDIYNFQNEAGGDPPVFTGPPPMDTDWQDMIFRDALIQNHQLGINGGSDIIQYNVSGSYFDQEGIVRGSDFERYSLRINLDITASEKFKFGNSLNVSRSVNNAAVTEGETTNGITSIGIRHSPILGVYLDDGTYATHDDLPSTVPDAQGNLNPMVFVNEYSDESVSTRILGNIFGEYYFTPELKFRISLGVDSENQDRHIFRTSKFFKTNPLNSANVSSVRRLSLLNENTLNYTKSFGAHNITALAGFTAQKEEEEFRGISASGFATDITGPYDLGGGSIVPGVSSNFAEFSILSFIGRVNYNYNDRFLVTVTGRQDGSSKFAEGNKWAFFPSVAGAWRISNEDFMAGSKGVVDNLKLRVGWGQTGNQELPSYRSLALLQATPYNFGDGTIVNGFSPLRVPVPNLTWEISTQTNIGMDLSLFDSKFNLTVDYYNKETDDLLLEVQLPETSGILDPSVQNLGTMKNTGWEFTFDGVLVNSTDLRWDLGFNLAFNDNEVTSLGGESEVGSGDQSYELPRTTFAGESITGLVTEGESLGVFYGYKSDGLYRSQTEADAGQSLQPGVIPGMVRYVDVNGDGVLDPSDRTIIGNPFPDFLYGINSSLAYKAFELRLFFQGQQGGDVYNTMRSFNMSVSRGQNVLRERADSWTPENPDAAHPLLTSNPPVVGGSGAQGESDWYLEDASYLRMREITLNYNFPNDIFGVLNGSVYLTGQNLFTITDYKGFNPDTNGRANVRGSFGWDISSYPLARTVILGLKLNF